MVVLQRGLFGVGPLRAGAWGECVRAVGVGLWWGGEAVGCQAAADLAEEWRRLAGRLM